MRFSVILFLLTLSANAICQVKPKDLIGEWVTCNSDSSYYKAGEIELHQNINYSNSSNCCYFIIWKITSGKLMNVENLYRCAEPGRISKSDRKETFKIKGRTGNQEIEIRRSNEVIVRFQVLDYKEIRNDGYPYNTKTLKLKRLKS